MATAFHDTRTFATSLATYRDMGIEHLQVVLPTGDPSATVAPIAEIARASST